jgi:hypothetical protein
MSLIKFLIKIGFVRRINSDIYYDFCKIFRTIGSGCLIIYYMRNPKQLIQISITDIVKDIIINFGFAIGIALIEDKIFKINKKRDQKHVQEFSINVLENVPTGFFELLPVVGEDIIFLVNFLPKYKTNIWLRILTSTLFASLHLNMYQFKSCIYKILLVFTSLSIHKNIINHNITHFLLDYIVLNMMKLAK